MALPLNVNIVIIAIVFSLLPIVIVVMRFRARVLQGAKLGLDDYMILPALLMAVAQGIILVIISVDGALGKYAELDKNGRPTQDFVEMVNVYKEGLFYLTLVTFPALAFVKVSILLFYRRIFRGAIFSVITMALLVMTVAWGIAFFFAFLFHCNPIHLAWTGTPGSKKGCFYPIPMYYAHAISDTLFDVAIWSIPIPLVWRLVMPTRQKVAISAIFLLGAFVLGISIARCFFFFETGRGGINPAKVTYEAAPTLYWTFLESSIAVVCACLPTLRVLFKDASPQRMLRSWASKLSLRSSSHSHIPSDGERGSEDGQKGANIGLQSIQVYSDLQSLHAVQSSESQRMTRCG